MAKVIFFLMILSLFAFSSLGNEKIVLRVEKSVARLHVQHALVFEKDKVVLGLNSNIFCGPEKEVSLGLFERKQDALQRAHHALLVQVANRMKPRGPESGRFFDHAAKRYFLGRHEISGQENAVSMAESILSESCENKGWKAKNAMSVDIVRLKGETFLRARKLTNNSETSVAMTPLSRANCKRAGRTNTNNDVFDCVIEKFGVARLVAVK